MSTIRPDLPAIPAPTSGTAPAVRAAQADFFRAAMAQVGGYAQTPAAPIPTAETPKAAQGDRPVRPGSLLDIRV